MKVFSQLRLPSIHHLPSLPSASGIRAELRLVKESFQRAGRSIRRHVLRQPVPVVAPNHGPEQAWLSMNPAERWNNFSKINQIALAICKKVRSEATQLNSQVEDFLANVEQAALSLEDELNSPLQIGFGYELEAISARIIAKNQLTRLWKAVEELDASCHLPKGAGELICDFEDLSSYLSNEANGQASGPAPKISDAYMDNSDVRDLGFLHDLIRDDVVQKLADVIESNLSDAADAVQNTNYALASTHLSKVQELFVQLKQHLQDNYAPSVVQAHCATIDQRIAFFKE